MKGSLRERLVRALDPLPAGHRSTQGCAAAAVLVPVILDGETAELLFTRRTDDVETHKGQISFPGGVCDADDADPVDTALRETEEELGIPRTKIDVVGCLPELNTPTGFCITPVVGMLAGLPPLRPNAAEVAEVFTVPLSFFAGGRSEMWMVNGAEREVWFYDHGGTVIWGATAAMARMLFRRSVSLPPGDP